MKLFYSRWREMLDPDVEGVKAAFGGVFSPFGMVNHPADIPEGSELTIKGSLLGIGPESDEARALLDVAERAGYRPAAREAPLAYVTPDLPPPALNAIHAGHVRSQRPDALTVTAPVGERYPVVTGPRSVLRVARIPGGNIGQPGAVWAGSQRLVDELITAGFPADRTTWLPPAVEAPLGPGGDGVLVVLPMHDRDLCARLLDGLSGLDPSKLRLLPTIGGPATDAYVAGRLPDAALLPAISLESGLAALAGTSDVVVAIDPRDPFDRRALIAAASGAAVVTDAGGPAGDVLNPVAELDGDAPAGAIAAAIDDALADTATRQGRADAVRAVCAPDVVSARLRTLVEQLPDELGQLCRDAIGSSAMDVRSTTEPYPVLNNAGALPIK